MYHGFMKLLLCALLAAAAAGAQTFSASPLLDQTIEQAIQDGRIPGAVLLIGHQGQIVHRKAYGKRALVPAVEPMTVDTIFDLASLTKVVATTSSLMQLFEQGKFRLNDRVTQYFPEFQDGKSDITLRNLFTHFSGLPPDLPLTPPWSGYQTGIHMAMHVKPDGPPGARFVYSDINFILLGELVHRLSGQMLSDYSREHIFLPLGMQETMFQPPPSLAPRIAPTERDGPNGAPWRGVVHDETARFMGGVAGDAGLFSTADDLARFCEMMLRKGERNGTRLFSPLTVEKFTTPAKPRRSAHPARPRLGYRFAIFRQPRRVVPHRFLRPHRLYRHVHLDRSSQRHVRDSAGQQRAPVPPAGHNWTARQGRDHHRGGAGHRRARRGPDRLQRDDQRSGAAPRGGAQRPDHDWPGRAGRRWFRAAQRQTRRADHEPDRRRPYRASATST